MLSLLNLLEVIALNKNISGFGYINNIKSTRVLMSRPIASKEL